MGSHHACVAIRTLICTVDDSIEMTSYGSEVHHCVHFSDDQYSRSMTDLVLLLPNVANVATVYLSFREIIIVHCIH